MCSRRHGRLPYPRLYVDISSGTHTSLYPTGCVYFGLKAAQPIAVVVAAETMLAKTTAEIGSTDSVFGDGGGADRGGRGGGRDGGVGVGGRRVVGAGAGHVTSQRGRKGARPMMSCCSPMT